MLFGTTVVESEPALLDERLEVVPGDAVVLAYAQDSLGLILEVLHAIDVLACVVHEFLAVIDALVLELTNVEHVVALEAVEAVGVHDGSGWSWA